MRIALNSKETTVLGEEEMRRPSTHCENLGAKNPRNPFVDIEFVSRPIYLAFRRFEDTAYLIDFAEPCCQRFIIAVSYEKPW